MMIAGEASGDLHGSGVVRELRRLRPEISVFGIGGDMMASEGMEVAHHIDALSVMGFVEVIRHLPAIRRIEQSLRELLATRKPDIVVLIDYPGFNLRFARRVKQMGIPILYYISPQVWAWNPGRVGTIRKLVDQMNVVFPFEEEIYRRAGVPVEFVGHPLLERLRQTGPRAEFFTTHGLDQGRKLLALLPGSRVQEVRMILPPMLEAAAELQRTMGVQVAIGGAPAIGDRLFAEFLNDGERVQVVRNTTYGLMEHADAAIVTSGTATLETAWFGTPMAVVYRTSPVSYRLGKFLVKIPHISLVNIVSGKEVVPEFLQDECRADTLVPAVRRMLTDTEYRGTIQRELSRVKMMLGSPGASERVARNILALVS